MFLAIIFLIVILIFSGHVYAPRTLAQQVQHYSAKPERRLFLFITSIVLAVYPALFLYTKTFSFMTDGIHSYALGINMTLYVLAVVTFLHYIHTHVRRERHTRTTLAILASLAFIGVSFMLYDNTYLSTISAILFPIVIFIFYTPLAILGERQYFSSALFGHLPKFIHGAKQFKNIFTPHAGIQQRGVMKRVLIGIGIFALLAVGIILPLLMSADASFATLIQSWVKDIDFATFWNGGVRIAFAYILWIFVTGLLFYLLHDAPRDEMNLTKVGSMRDSIISGIVIGGSLAVYLLFLGVQWKNLIMTSALPDTFTDTVTLVKSGFWQLFVLSAFNALLYIAYYKRTHPIVQKILMVFTAASLALVVVAAHKLYLYVYSYGLSYEKFFASYTALYSVLLFIFLLGTFLSRYKINIFKFIFTSALVLYAVATVLPIESIIFNTNRALAGKPQTHVLLSELQMLSADMIPAVKKHADELVATDLQNQSLMRRESDRVSHKEIDESDHKALLEDSWRTWTADRTKKKDAKKWYQKDVREMF